MKTKVVVEDDLWSAVGDPMRRRLLDLLIASGTGTGTGTATSLSKELPITRQAVTKHLRVLERAGLVHAEPLGREMRYVIDVDRLARTAAQLTSVTDAWSGRLRRIKELAETIERTKHQQAER